MSRDLIKPRSDALKGLKVASFYSGAGGLDIGFAWAGAEIVWANDFDKTAVDTYNGILGNHAHHGSVIDDEWLETVGMPDKYAGKVDIVVGGPPCQGFSVAGRMDPHDPRSEHVWRFLEMVEWLQPRVFVMENVKSLGTNPRWEPVRQGLREKADDLGYDTELFVLKAIDYGVPQKRERMFLIGIRKGTGKIEEPLKVTEGKPRTVRQALATLPPFGEPGNNTKCTAKITLAKNPVLRPSAYAGSLLFNGNGRPLRLDAPSSTLPASMGGNATPIVDQDQLDDPKGDGVSKWLVNYHKRLWARKGKPGGRVPKSLRRITVEEAAAIQTFPKGMRWAGKGSAKYRQIGNAVPPELAYHVALAVAKALKA